MQTREGEYSNTELSSVKHIYDHVFIFQVMKYKMLYLSVV